MQALQATVHLPHLSKDPRTLCFLFCSFVTWGCKNLCSIWLIVPERWSKITSLIPLQQGSEPKTRKIRNSVLGETVQWIHALIYPSAPSTKLWQIRYKYRKLKSDIWLNRSRISMSRSVRPAGLCLKITREFGSHWANPKCKCVRWQTGTRKWSRSPEEKKKKKKSMAFLCLETKILEAWESRMWHQRSDSQAETDQAWAHSGLVPFWMSSGFLWNKTPKTPL